MTSSARRPEVLALQGLLADACMARSPAIDPLTVEAAAARGIAPNDAQALLAGPHRLGLYRQLVRGNLFGVARAILEASAACFDARVPGAFAEAMDGFLDEVGPRTSHLRDVPGEFVAWAVPRWRDDPRVPGWLVDHARFELAEFTISTSASPRTCPAAPLSDLHPDRAVAFDSPRELLSLAWAVHVPERPWTRDALAHPERRDVSLLLYRDQAHRARVMELSPLAAAILSELFQGRTLGSAITRACVASSRAVDAAVLASTSELLADLGERGVLLGAVEPAIASHSQDTG